MCEPLSVAPPCTQAWSACGIRQRAQNADKGKAAKLRALGAEVTLHGDDGLVTETFARQEAARLQGSYVSPYNDVQARRA